LQSILIVMKIDGAQVIFYVKNMEASREFYGGALGLPLTYDGGDYWLTYDLGGTTLALHPGGSGEPSEDRTGISLLVSDLEEAREFLNERGAGFGEVLNPHPGVLFAVTRDPDGNPVFLKPMTV